MRFSVVGLIVAEKYVGNCSEICISLNIELQRDLDGTAIENRHEICTINDSKVHCKLRMSIDIKDI